MKTTMGGTLLPITLEKAIKGHHEAVLCGESICLCGLGQTQLRNTTTIHTRYKGQHLQRPNLLTNGLSVAFLGTIVSMEFLIFVIVLHGFFCDGHTEHLLLLGRFSSIYEQFIIK